MDMLLNDGIRRKCTLKKVLYIPELAYNLISVARAGEAEKMVHFDNSSCEFQNKKDEIIAVSACEGSLYLAPASTLLREAVTTTRPLLNPYLPNAM